MTLAEIVKKLNLTVKTGAELLERDVKGGYVSDLMSDVMANANEADLWVTLQIHQNIVAVAVMKSLAGIVLINGREPETETVEKATAEGLPIMVTDMPAFELVGRLFAMGISGS
ncbi:MAG: serine kinase [Deltaproteobacteria bacterium]|nr:serine kinase [Deltaproteobacteria bacterium]